MPPSNPQASLVNWPTWGFQIWKNCFKWSAFSSVAFDCWLVHFRYSENCWLCRKMQRVRVVLVVLWVFLETTCSEVVHHCPFLRSRVILSPPNLGKSQKNDKGKVSKKQRHKNASTKRIKRSKEVEPRAKRVTRSLNLSPFLDICPVVCTFSFHSATRHHFC